MRERLRLFIFIDALGWNLVEKYQFAEFLTARCKVRTQFGYSAGAVPTILSGRTPREHGHFSFFRYDPEHSPFRKFAWFPSWLLPDWFFGRHRVRHHISKALKKLLGFTGYFQLYRMPFARLGKLDYSEKRDMFVPGGLESVQNLADVWTAQHRAWHISDWRKSSDFNFEEFEKLIARESIECGFLYSAALDGFLHLHVGEPDAVRTEFKKYEEKLVRLLALAQEHYKEVVFAVFSDHGMTPLAGTLDLREVFRPYRWGRDFASVTDSTMVRLWWLSEPVRAVLRPAVAALGHGHYLSDAEKEDFGIDFESDSYGNDIYLLDAGWQFAPSDMGARPLPGMHGFSPCDGDSDACFLSNAAPPVAPVWIGDFFRIMTAPDTQKQH